MKNNSSDNLISISEKCENLKNTVVNRVERKCVQSIRADIKDEAIANDCKEEFVFPAPKAKGNVVAICITSIFLFMFLLLLLFSICITVFSSDYRLYGLCGVVLSLIVLIINSVIIYKSVSTIQFNKRYNRYYIYLRNRKCALTDDMSRLFNISKAMVIKDIKQALLYRYIPQGHLVNEDKLIIFSSDSFAEYTKKKSKVDEKVNRLLQVNVNEDEEYVSVISTIEATLGLIKEIKKKDKYSVIKKELHNMENILMSIKYSNDLVDDDVETITTYVNCYCTSMERLIEAYFEVINNSSYYSNDSLKEAKEEYREALEYVNDAFEFVLSEYYETYSII